MPDERFRELTADRIFLRKFDLGDLRDFVGYRSLPDVARFQSWDAPFPADAAERMIRGLMRQHPDTPGEWYQFAIALRSTGQLIGDCGARTDGDGRQAEIGFTLAPAHQGRGYATEAVRALLGYLFGPRNKHRVTAACDARNTGSARLLERVGMRREGHLVASTWANGEWTDDLLYGLLEQEWRDHAGAT
jgi:aminoglycoside 6'-N-acetyltransferase